MRFRRSAIIAALATTAVLSCTPERAVAPFQLVSGTASIVDPPQVIISQIYSGGGNSGATYKNKFVELFNRGGSTASLAGWSIQYASSNGTGLFSAGSVGLATLSGSLAPGQYMLVQVGPTGSTGAPLPITPDIVSTTPNPSGTAGKLIIANTTTLIGCNGGSTACSPAQLAQIVDLVGYGTGSGGANFFEGSGPAPTLSSTLAGFQKDGGCQDTKDNAADFVTGAPAPRNSASPTHSCSVTVTLTGTGVANPPSVLPGATTLLTVTMTSFVSGTTITVSADLSSIGGTTTTALIDDGTNGDVSAGDHIFSRNVTVGSNVTPGAKVLPVALADNQSHSGSTSIALTVLAPPAVAPPLVITELMANPAAVDDNAPGGEWFEVFNSTHSAINMNGWTIVSGVAAGGTESHVISGDVIVPAGGFAVLGNNSSAATNGGVTEQYQYTGIFLGNNTTDWIKLVKTDLSVADSVSYSTRNASGVVTSPTYSPAAGISRAVIDISQDNSTMAGPNWADTPAGITYGAGDRGSPGTGPYFATGTGAPVLVVVTPNPAQVTPTGTRLFTATAKDADGLNTPSTFTWGSSNTSLATISTTGLVTGVALGTGVVITATSANASSGTATLDVVPPAVATITITMNNPHEIPAGFVKPAFTSAADANGNAISPAPTLTWSSADETIATVDANGYVTAVAPGTVTILATAANGVFGSLSVTIDPTTVPTSADYHNNVEFGVPTDGNPNDDILITRPQYELSYNATRGGPNWVSWDVNASVFGPVPRCDCFSPDPLLPSGVYHVVDSDYRNGLGGQIDRGHMTQSEERTATLQENATTFYLTNVLPQASENNQGPWSKLENDLNDSVRLGGREVHVIAGGIFSSNPKTLKGLGNVAIPDWTWKIAVIQPAGGTLADVHSVGDIDVIAVIMPNDTTVGTFNSARGIKLLPWQGFTTTVDAIEAATGYDFLDALPDQIEIQVESGDHPPVANIAGSTGGFEGSALSFDGSGSSDPDHDVLTWTWSFGDGRSATGATTSHTYADNGSYTVTLTVTDPHGVYDMQSRIVTVTNVAPVASFGAPASVDEGSAFTLSLDGALDPSSIDQASLRYAFDCGDGAGYGPLGAASSASCATNDNGTRAVRARVEDKDGGSNEYAGSVAIANVAPRATLSAPASLNEGSSFTLSLNGAFDPSSVDQSSLRYAFDCGDGAGYGPLGAASSAICATNDNGTRAVRARVEDKDGGATEYAGTVQVLNVAPTATLSAPASLNEGSTFALSLTGALDPSSVDQASLRYAFDCGDGAGYGPLGAASSASCATSNDGTRSIRARVEDKDGGATEYAGTVQVLNVAPTIAPFAGANLLTSETYAAAGSFTDPGSDTWTATVNYGDGSGPMPLSLSGKTFSLAHTYTSAGSFTVSVAVSDGAATTVRSQTVTVLSPAQGVQGIIADAPDLGSLRAKLNAAIQSLNRGNNGAAANQLGAFLNEVAALVRSGRMTTAQADALRAEVNRVLASMSSVTA